MAELLNKSLDVDGGQGVQNSSVSPDDSYFFEVTAVDIVVIVIRLMITLFGLPANALVIYVVYHFNDMRTYSNMFCASLAVTDNLCLIHDLIFSIPGKLISQQQTAEYSTVHCVLIGFGNVLLITGGFHLLVIAIDRFFFINFPFRYHLFLLRAKTLLIATCWVPGTLIGMAMETRSCHQKAFVDETENIIMRASLYGTLTVVVCSLYACILRTALKQRRLIRRSMPIVIDSNGRQTIAGSELDTIGRQIKALVGYFLIAISTFLNWILPIAYLLIVHAVIMQYDGKMPPSDVSSILLIMHQLLGVFMSLNSAINPVIYSFTQRPFKDSFGKVLKKVRESCQGSISPLWHRNNISTTQMVPLDEQFGRSGKETTVLNISPKGSPNSRLAPSYRSTTA